MKPSFSASGSHDLGLKRIRRELEPTIKSAHDSALTIPWADLKDRMHPKVTFSLTAAFHFSHATAVQRQSVPILSEVGRSAVIEAATGCGKTLAFLIPLVQRCLSYHDFFYNYSGDLQVNGVVSSVKRPPLTRAILGTVICPTRVLAQQSFIVARQLACRVPHAIQFFLCEPTTSAQGNYLNKYRGVFQAIERCPRTTGIALVGTAVDVLAVCEIIAKHMAETDASPRSEKTTPVVPTVTADVDDDVELDAATMEKMREAARKRRQEKQQQQQQGIAQAGKRGRDDNSPITEASDTAKNMAPTLQFPLNVAVRRGALSADGVRRQVDGKPAHCYYTDSYYRFVSAKGAPPASSKKKQKTKSTSADYISLPAPRPLVIIDEADVILRNNNYNTEDEEEAQESILDRLMALFAVDRTAVATSNSSSTRGADFALVGATVNTREFFQPSADPEKEAKEETATAVSEFIAKWYNDESDTEMHKIKIGTEERYLSQLKNRFILFGDSESTRVGGDAEANRHIAGTENISYNFYIPELINLINKHPSKKHIVFCENLSVLKYIHALLKLLAGDKDTHATTTSKPSETARQAEHKQMTNTDHRKYLLTMPSHSIYVLYDTSAMGHGKSQYHIAEKNEGFSGFLQHDPATFKPLNTTKKVRGRIGNGEDGEEEEEVKTQITTNKHRNISQTKGFKLGSGAVLLCTDMAAYGLDIRDVDYVYHIEVPKTVPQYLHRIGRVARMGMQGTSILFMLAPDSFEATNDKEKEEASATLNQYLNQLSDAHELTPLYPRVETASRSFMARNSSTQGHKEGVALQTLSNFIRASLASNAELAEVAREAAMTLAQEDANTGKSWCNVTVALSIAFSKNLSADYLEQKPREDRVETNM